MKKLSQSKASSKHLLKSSPLPNQTKQKLELANEKANETCKSNQHIYTDSALHAGNYPIADAPKSRVLKKQK